MSQKNIYRVFLVGCFIIGSAVTTSGQGVYEAWVARYNGPGNNLDEAIALAVDDSGFVYVTGSSYGSSGFYDYATIKYTSKGDTVWVRRYDGPIGADDKANALAVDAGGNIYVSGYSTGAGTLEDYTTTKYSPVGDTLWVRRYNGPADLVDRAAAVAVDDSGNVYVTGRSQGKGSLADYLTIKYSPLGDTVWVRRYDGPANNDDRAQAIQVDDSGYVYVTGHSRGTGSLADYATLKYSPFGDTLWVRRYNDTTGNDLDQAIDLMLDQSGSVYVTGQSRGGGTSSDYATIKYSSAGNLIWVRRYNGPANSVDQANSLVLDENGSVYVTGQSRGSGSSLDYATINYTSFGDTVWIKRYNGPGNDFDRAWALAIDTSGNLYVTGISFGSGSDFDYATIKYAPNGDTLWVRRYNGPGNFYDGARALAVDNSGNVYVAGRSEGSGTSLDYATIKYSPCSAIPGDVNASGAITIGDIIHLVNYIFDKDRLPCLGADPGNCWTPGPFCRGDVNQTGTITIGDIVHLVNYIFDEDRLPCLGSNPGNCWTPEASGACCLAVP